MVIWVGEVVVASGSGVQCGRLCGSAGRRRSLVTDAKEINLRCCATAVG